MRWLFTILLILPLLGCRTTEKFRGSRDEVFDAAVASVPMTSGGMRLKSSDRTKGTFKGLLVDGFGNVYLNGRVRAASDHPDETIVEVDAWSWSLATLFLLPLDADWAERRFLETLAEQTPRAQRPVPKGERIRGHPELTANSGCPLSAAPPARPYSAHEKTAGGINPALRR